MRQLWSAMLDFTLSQTCFTHLATTKAETSMTELKLEK